MESASWTWRPWAQHRKGTFITDQLSGEEAFGFNSKMFETEKINIKINKSPLRPFPGLNLHPETASRFGSRHLCYRCRGNFTHGGHICVTFELVRQTRWFSWFRDEGGYSAGGSCRIELNHWTGYSLWGWRRIWWAEPATDDLLDRGVDDRSYEWGSRPRDKWASLWCGSSFKSLLERWCRPSCNPPSYSTTLLLTLILDTA